MRATRQMVVRAVVSVTNERRINVASAYRKLSTSFNAACPERDHARDLRGGRGGGGRAGGEQRVHRTRTLRGRDQRRTRMQPPGFLPLGSDRMGSVSRVASVQGYRGTNRRIVALPRVVGASDRVSTRNGASSETLTAIGMHNITEFESPLPFSVLPSLPLLVVLVPPPFFRFVCDRVVGYLAASIAPRAP